MAQASLRILAKARQRRLTAEGVFRVSIVACSLLVWALAYAAAFAPGWFPWLLIGLGLAIFAAGVSACCIGCPRHSGRAR